jgi:hypothetical protein
MKPLTDQSPEEKILSDLLRDQANDIMKRDMLTGLIEVRERNIEIARKGVAGKNALKTVTP